MQRITPEEGENQLYKYKGCFLFIEQLDKTMYNQTERRAVS